MTWQRNALAGGLVVLVAGFGLLPFWVTKDPTHRKAKPNLTMSEEPLAGNVLIRGAYINSGSRDAGRDPDWVVDPATKRMTYVGRGPRTVVTPDDVERYRAEQAAKQPPTDSSSSS